MDKASGVYFSLTDESVKISGSSSLDIIISGVSQKGSISKLNTVTANNLREVLGYDLSYSSEMLGVSQVLEVVDRIRFMRVNKDAYVGNAYYLEDAVAKTLSSTSSAEEVSAISDLVFSISHKDAGDWGPRAFKIVPRASIYNVSTVESGLPYRKKFSNKMGTFSNFTLMPNTTDYKYEGLEITTIDGKVLAGIKLPNNVLPDDLLEIHLIDPVTGNFTTGIGVYSRKVGTPDILTLTSTPGPAIFKIKIYEESYSEYTLEYAEVVTSTIFKIISEKDFSTDSTSKIYWKTLNFKDVKIDGTMLLSSFLEPTKRDFFDNWTVLLSGDNGVAPTSIADVNYNLLTASGANILALNGLQTCSIVNGFLEKGTSELMSVFVDMPAYQKYEDAELWAQCLRRTQYGSICAVPDVVRVDGVGEVYLWPSLNLVKIYASMLATYGTLNYPPAGVLYGSVAVSSFLPTDFNSWANELKSNRINYQKSGPNGPVMWEQRTLNGLNSDLSYLNTVFILRSLRSQLISYMQNFNFQLTTGDQLLIIESGLYSIFNSMKTRNFLSSFNLDVPSFEEAQSMGREIDILMSASITQDGEVYNLNLKLVNYAS